MEQQEKWLKKFGASNTYNKHCKHLSEKDGNYRCKIKMEMMFCGNKCAYATNQVGSNKAYKGIAMENNRYV